MVLSVRCEGAVMPIPAWYRRYFEWARAKSPRSRMVFVFSMALFTVGGMQIIGQAYGPEVLVRTVGWLMLVLSPIAALDAWAAGILAGQRVAPWVRLFAISGVGVAVGAYILLGF
jgi:hypothetical protein